MEMIEIVWTAPSGTKPQARVHAGQICVVGERAHITSHAYDKLSKRGLCKKASTKSAPRKD